jgi:hypothetical protein
MCIFSLIVYSDKLKMNDEIFKSIRKIENIKILAHFLYKLLDYRIKKIA